ncbi:MAG: FtsQ-type POTRA domain-containing protein [Acidobacteriota bacterium]|nr:FtsQ-type POTRA domain-containing protein [Acidobacteriota bacterium]
MTTPSRAVAGEFLRPRHPRRRRRSSPAVALVRVLARAFMVVAPPLAVASWLVRSGGFELANLEAQVTGRVAESWVRARLGPEMGQNLVTLPLDRVQARLDGHPWIASVVVDKALPNGLRVSIEEREPAAVLTSGGSLVYVDVAGQRIAPVGANDSVAGLLRVRPKETDGGPPTAMELAETQCLERAIELGRSLESGGATLPIWLSQLHGLEVVGDDDFRLFSRGLAFPVLVRSTDGAERIRELATLMARIREDGDSAGDPFKIREIDLRYRGQVIVRSGEAAQWDPNQGDVT